MSNFFQVITSTDYYEVTWEVEYSVHKHVPATHLDPPEGGIEIEAVEPILITFYFDDEDEESVDVHADESPRFAASIMHYCQPLSDHELIIRAEESYDHSIAR